MIAHVHLLMISVMAAFGPEFPGADSLLLLDGEKDEVRRGASLHMYAALCRLRLLVVESPRGVMCIRVPAALFSI